jgi:hypothetical protein
VKVEKLYYGGSCDDCGEWTTVYEIRSRDGYVVMKLCKGCMLDLIKAIMEK